MTLNEINVYLALKPYSTHTRFQYKYRLRRFLLWCSKERITPNQFDAIKFLQYSFDNEWVDGSSIQRNAYHCIRGYLQWKLGNIQPLTGLRFQRDKSYPQRTLNEQERNQIIDSLIDKTRNAPTHNKRNMATRNLAIISLTLDTGLRSSEICSLKTQRLDLTERCTFVLRKMQRWHAPLFSRVTEERIRQWLTVRVGIAKPGVGNVFIGVGGKNPGWGLTTVGIRCIMIKVAREAGVKHFSPHALRRTMATIMIRNGAPTHLVQAQGDWSNSSMLENYTRDINPEDIAPFFATS